MVKTTLNPTCGNAPKKDFLKQFNIAFVNGNTTFLEENVTDNIIWNIIGSKKIEGKVSFKIELQKMKNKAVTELVLNHILTHGKEGAVNGIVKMENGKKYAFSDFYEFSGAKGMKIKLITSYIIAI